MASDSLKRLTSNNQLCKHLYVDESRLHGYGLFARRKLKRGEYIGTYDGPKTKRNDIHVLWVEDKPGKWCGRDGTNLLRYLNHSHKPNCEFDGFDLYTLCKIKETEELVFDYGEDPA
ncbi:MAG: hypothetical protein DHS20C01_02870 [marine bacterium B5-7]|nr:MAG: hypothetical protein DHS20C01_02870 [marine bacterium B5-7]